MELTHSDLKRMLSYNPETGEWIWLGAPNHNTRLNGKKAGSRRYDEYLLIRIHGCAYYSGRLAWFYMTGYWPDEEIDHIDRDPSNDCWDNLREASSSQNKWNRQTYSGAGYKGVYPCGEKWQVQVGGVYHGIFDDLDAAVVYRDQVALTMAGDFAVLNQIGT